MKFRLTQPWQLDAVIAPVGTVIDANGDDYWAQQARGKVIPFTCVALDVEAYEAQLKAYPDAKHLLSGGWEEK